VLAGNFVPSSAMLMMIGKMPAVTFLEVSININTRGAGGRVRCSVLLASRAKLMNKHDSRVMDWSQKS